MFCFVLNLQLCFYLVLLLLTEVHIFVSSRNKNNTIVRNTDYYMYN